MPVDVEVLKRERLVSYQMGPSKAFCYRRNQKYRVPSQCVSLLSWIVGFVASSNRFLVRSPGFSLALGLKVSCGP